MNTPSKERIQRVKQETRCNILEASLKIAKEDGWGALSMRKVADMIQYTAPMIYEYFSNKEAILEELTNKGYRILNERLLNAKSQHADLEKQLEAIWLEYWNFAFDETELYQLMYGVEVNCCVMGKECKSADDTYDIITDVIKDLIKEEDPSEDLICRKYYTFWSIVHGLVSINITRRGASEEINKQILRDAITGIIRTITI